MSRLGRRKIGKVESKIGVGSTFTVTIPCRIASKDEAQVKRDTTVTVQCHGRIKIRKDAQGTMTIQECYKKMGADYEDVLKRLYSEGMIRKFARMFLDDDSYPKLEDALKKENVEEAFRAAHTLKGVCQNLGFTNLYQPAYELTEVLRAGTLEGSKEWFDRVTEQYNITIDAIRAVQ